MTAQQTNNTNHANPVVKVATTVPAADWISATMFSFFWHAATPFV